MKLFEMVDKYLENPHKIHTERHKGFYHPSQASCLYKNEYGEEAVTGSCLRSVYWEIKGVKATNPMTARGARICAVGKMVEKFEIEQYKQMGIWRDNNVKFFNERYNISGEADCIVQLPDVPHLTGVEVKSGYDYKFRKEVIGTPVKPGRPKYEHMLQTMLYIDYFKIPFRLLYIDRGNAARAEYELTLNDDGTPNIDGKRFNIGLSVPRIISRYKVLEEHLKDSTLPRRDFQLKYSKERLELLNSSKRLSKKNSEEFDKNSDIDLGDWQCSYCDYKDYCWKDGKNG